MYIAGRWLMGLALTMWVAMCGFDELLKRSKEINKGFDNKPVGFVYENITIPNKKESKILVERYRNDKMQGTIQLHYFMFIAGALAVSLFNKKKEIIIFTRRKFLQVNFCVIFKSIEYFLNNSARKVGVAMVKCSNQFWEKINEFTKIIKKIFMYIIRLKRDKTHGGVNILLLKKLKEFVEERKNLAELLLAAIQENKHIRTQHQLESMAKNRLARHIENTQKQIKENRYKYVSFQQLYLVTQQENIFLKTRIVKLTKEKNEAEKKLMNIINEVYKSKNNELKAYCSRFIVRTKESLIRSDVSQEIHKFLQNSRNTGPCTSNYHICEQCDVEVNTDNNWTRFNENNTTIADESHYEHDLMSLVSYPPKLKGLPGEVVWTVKDKNGLIEKLYEYDIESEFDSGDTIRRIREYSVYYDKDCLLDFRNSRTLIQETKNDSRQYQNSTAEHPLTSSQKFLTGSQAFQNFLQSNKNIVKSSRSRPPLLMCR